MTLMGKKIGIIKMIWLSDIWEDIFDWVKEKWENIYGI